MNKDDFVLENRKNTIIGIALMSFTFTILLFVLILFITKLFDIYTTLILLFIFVIPGMIALFFNYRLKIIYKNNEFTIISGFKKKKIININELSRIEIITRVSKKDLVRGYDRQLNKIEFYNKKNELIKKIANFPIKALDEYNYLQKLCEEKEIEIIHKTDMITNLRKYTLISIIVTISFLELFMVIGLIILNVQYNQIKNTKEADLVYFEGTVKEIENSDGYSILFEEDDEYYQIDGYLDLNIIIHKDDYLKLNYLIVMGQKHVASLTLNNELIYNYDYFIGKANSYHKTINILLLSMAGSGILVIGLYYIYYCYKNRKDEEFKNSLNKYHKVGIDGIHYYDIGFKYDFEVLKENMLSKLVLDGITIFLVNKEEYYIGYKKNDKKALIDAYKENNYLIISDYMFFYCSGMTLEFNSNDQKEFLNYFDEIEKITYLKPIFESKYEENLED